MGSSGGCSERSQGGCVVSRSSDEGPRQLLGPSAEGRAISLAVLKYLQGSLADSCGVTRNQGRGEPQPPQVSRSPDSVTERRRPYDSEMRKASQLQNVSWSCIAFIAFFSGTRIFC